jgi:peroxiredoxin
MLLFAGVFVLTLGAGSAGYYFYQYTTGAAMAAQPVHTSAGARTAPDITGSILPEFSLPDINGGIRDVREWHGKVLAINFWATWCPPCLKEIPEFIALQDKYAGQGLQFVGIALQGPEEVRDFIREHGMNYPVLVGELEVVDLARTLGNDMGALPYTVIIDRQQRISFVKHGQLDGDQAEAIIKALL